MPARKSTASVTKTTAKRTVARRRPARAKAGPLEFGSRHYRLTATEGSLELVGPDGQVWQPAACGEHRSVPVRESASDEEPATAKGFQSSCEECRTQATGTAAHAVQHFTV